TRWPRRGRAGWCRSSRGRRWDIRCAWSWLAPRSSFRPLQATKACGQILSAISEKIWDMAGPASRVLQLLSLLQTHKFWPGTELAQHLEVSPRTVRRDIDRLRALGYPVDATPGVAGGYQLAAGTHLPPLLLDDDEA